MGAEPFPYRQLVRFAVLVPLRIWSEINSIRRADVVSPGRWTASIQKTDTTQVLLLHRMAVDVLTECPLTGPYFFGRPRTPNGTQVSLKKRLGKRSGVDGWIFHDFRTAFMTHLGDLGVPFDLRDQIQRPHSDQRVGRKHYDMSIRPEEKGEVLAFWAYCLNAWIDGKGPKQWREFLADYEHRAKVVS